jgi:hypothetical protein
MTAAFLAFSHAALVAAYHSGLGGAMRTTNARRAVSPVSDLSILGAQDAVNGGVLLPRTPFEGACPPLIFGEMNLQELEDDQECRTQIFLHPDGTVSHGATEGPPPVDACGLWQCGAKQFQMTLTRSFLIPGKTPPRGEHSGKTNLKECSYSVTRIYLGEVNPNADGVNVVDGRMELYDELRYTPAQDPTAIFNFHGTNNNDRSPYSGEVLTSFQLDAPIGWFSLDKVVEEGEGPEGEPVMQTMRVQVPGGMTGGMLLQVQTPAGLMEVQIPRGLEPGETFEMLVPMSAQE